MPLPNFFVIGAPKSGTTALYHCLKQHPDIFMPDVKEPAYFRYGGRKPDVYPGPVSAHHPTIWRQDDYFRLFAEAGGRRAIGDATPSYLRSPEAAQRINANIPAAQIVALLRQPADRAFSAYLYMRQHGVEPARTFEEALRDEPARRERGWFSGLYHKANGLYGEQLDVWYSLFPRDQIKVYLYEEWDQSPDALLQDLFGFLDVAPDFQPVIRRNNVTQMPRSYRLHRIAVQPERVQKRLGRPAASLASWLNRRCNRIQPPPLDPELRRRLTDEYRVDILQLQSLINRDLSHWL